MAERQQQTHIRLKGEASTQVPESGPAQVKLESGTDTETKSRDGTGPDRLETPSSPELGTGVGKPGVADHDYFNTGKVQGAFVSLTRLAQWSAREGCQTARVQGSVSSPSPALPEPSAQSSATIGKHASNSVRPHVELPPRRGYNKQGRPPKTEGQARPGRPRKREGQTRAAKGEPRPRSQSRRRQSDAKWRASVASCFAMLSSVVPKDGSRSRKVIPKAMIMEEVRRHILRLEEGLEDLITIKAEQAGKNLLTLLDNEWTPVSIDIFKQQFMENYKDIQSMSGAGRRRGLPTVDVEQHILSLGADLSRLLVVPSLLSLEPQLHQPAQEKDNISSVGKTDPEINMAVQTEEEDRTVPEASSWDMGTGGDIGKEQDAIPEIFIMDCLSHPQGFKTPPWSPASPDRPPSQQPGSLKQLEVEREEWKDWTLQPIPPTPPSPLLALSPSSPPTDTSISQASNKGKECSDISGEDSDSSSLLQYSAFDPGSRESTPPRPRRDRMNVSSPPRRSTGSADSAQSRCASGGEAKRRRLQGAYQPRCRRSLEKLYSEPQSVPAVSGPASPPSSATQATMTMSPAHQVLDPAVSGSVEAACSSFDRYLTVYRRVAERLEGGEAGQPVPLLMSKFWDQLSGQEQQALTHVATMEWQEGCSHTVMPPEPLGVYISQESVSVMQEWTASHSGLNMEPYNFLRYPGPGTARSERSSCLPSPFSSGSPLSGCKTLDPSVTPDLLDISLGSLLGEGPGLQTGDTDQGRVMGLDSGSLQSAERADLGTEKDLPWQVEDPANAGQDFPGFQHYLSFLTPQDGCPPDAHNGSPTLSSLSPHGLGMATGQEGGQSVPEDGERGWLARSLTQGLQGTPGLGETSGTHDSSGSQTLSDQQVPCLDDSWGCQDHPDCSLHSPGLKCGRLPLQRLDVQGDDDSACWGSQAVPDVDLFFN